MGLYYLQSRYYNPEIGRFINADGLRPTVMANPADERRVDSSYDWRTGTLTINSIRSTSNGIVSSLIEGSIVNSTDSGINYKVNPNDGYRYKYLKSVKKPMFGKRLSTAGKFKSIGAKVGIVGGIKGLIDIGVSWDKDGWKDGVIQAGAVGLGILAGVGIGAAVGAFMAPGVLSVGIGIGLNIVVGTLIDSTANSLKRKY